jgi:hypothetical protein
LAGDDDRSVIVFDGDSSGQVEVEFAFGALDDDGAAVEFDIDFFWKRDGFESDS